LDLCNKIAALLSDVSVDEFGVTEEQLEQSVEDKDLKSIAELLGEILEDLEIDCGEVD